jgi:hypothetical protein
MTLYIPTDPQTVLQNKELPLVVHYMCGFTVETMKPQSSLEYTGDIVDLGMHVWSDLRRFNAKMFQFDKDLITGIHISVPGLKAQDPRLLAIRDKIQEYILLMNRKNNPALC